MQKNLSINYGKFCNNSFGEISTQLCVIKASTSTISETIYLEAKAEDKVYITHLFYSSLY